MIRMLIHELTVNDEVTLVSSGDVSDSTALSTYCSLIDKTYGSKLDEVTHSHCEPGRIALTHKTLLGIAGMTWVNSPAGGDETVYIYTFSSRGREHCNEFMLMHSHISLATRLHPDHVMGQYLKELLYGD